MHTHEDKLTETIKAYAQKFGILNLKGRACVVRLGSTDLSQVMGYEDFEKLHRDEWFPVNGKSFYPAKSFLAEPPEGVQVFKGGVVFRPNGDAAPDQYNLFQGLKVQADGSGDCSLVYDLLRDVWACGNQERYEWVREYLWHLVSRPGERVRTSLALRGEPGTGKSLLFDGPLRDILDDMLLSVVNHNDILGNHNEAAMGKLAIVLEEAAFAGSKELFERLKQLITGPRIHINPKYLRPFETDNYARLIVISNHGHFLSTDTNDRRYTVLEVSSVWKGTHKFAALIEQWRNGGAGRFLHDAKTHEFRRDGNGELVINTIIKTDEAARQKAQSRSGLQKCIVHFLRHGDFCTGRQASFFEDMPAGTVKPLHWELDNELQIPSKELERAVKDWLREDDKGAAQRANLTAIIETLHEYVATSKSAPKVNVDGVRKSGPTLRVLPPRRKALDDCLQKGLITAEEHDAALESDQGPSALRGRSDDDPQDDLMPLDNVLAFGNLNARMRNLK